MGGFETKKPPDRAWIGRLSGLSWDGLMLLTQPVANLHISLDPAIAIAQPQHAGQFFGLAAQSGDVFGGEFAPFALDLIF